MHPCTYFFIAILASFVPSGTPQSSDSGSDSGAVLDNPHEFKIFTFHRDEDELLQDWVKYHARIVGKGNLYILDNNSTSPTALRHLEAMEKVGWTGHAIGGSRPVRVEHLL